MLLSHLVYLGDDEDFRSNAMSPVVSTLSLMQWSQAIHSFSRRLRKPSPEKSVSYAAHRCRCSAIRVVGFAVFKVGRFMTCLGRTCCDGRHHLNARSPLCQPTGVRGSVYRSLHLVPSVSEETQFCLITRSLSLIIQPIPPGPMNRFTILRAPSESLFCSSASQ